MDDVVSRAYADRAAAAERVEALTRDLTTAKAELEKVDTFLELLARYQGEEGKAGPPKRSRTRIIIKRRPVADPLARAAADAIATTPAKLSITALLEAVKIAGFDVGGERPTTNLSSVLSRSDLVTYSRERGWEVTDKYRHLLAEGDQPASKPEDDDADL